MEWVLEESTHGASCLGPLAGLGEKKKLYEATVNALSNGKQTTLVLVTRPDISPLQEAARASKELGDIGVQNQMLLINGMMQNQVKEDEVSKAFYERQTKALEQTPNKLKQIPTYAVPLAPFNITGIENLRRLFIDNAISDVETLEVEDIKQSL